MSQHNTPTTIMVFISAHSKFHIRVANDLKFDKVKLKSRHEFTSTWPLNEHIVSIDTQSGVFFAFIRMHPLVWCVASFSCSKTTFSPFWIPYHFLPSVGPEPIIRCFKRNATLQTIFKIFATYMDCFLIFRSLSLFYFFFFFFLFKKHNSLWFLSVL